MLGASLSTGYKHYTPVYMYPARFPYSLLSKVDELAKGLGQSLTILDPFAGSGSICIAAALKGWSCEAWDINPLSPMILDAHIKIMQDPSRLIKALKLIEKAAGQNQHVLDTDDKLYEWWPAEVIPLLSRVWGYFQYELAYFDNKSRSFRPHSILWSVYGILALHATRKVGYTDDGIPKYFRSKVKREKLKRLGPAGIRYMFYKALHDRALRLASHYGVSGNTGRSNTLISWANDDKKPRINMLVVDAVEAEPPSVIDLIITSPPYLAAQEYIRSFKYDLVWAGVDWDTIRWAQKKEIPYRPPIEGKIIHSTIIRDIEEELDEKGRRLLLSYFTNTLHVLEKTSRNLRKGGRIAVFVGEATLRGRIIPIHKIILEHLSKTQSLQPLNGGIPDPISKRRLFIKKRRNSNPNGIKKEFLIILEK